MKYCELVFIISLICVSAVMSQVPSCLMPCKPSSDPLITESSLHHTVTHSFDSLHLSSKLNGIRAELKVIVRTNSEYYSRVVNVKGQQVDEVYNIIKKTPEISYDSYDNKTLCVKFKYLQKIILRLQENTVSDEFGLLDKVYTQNSQLNTVQNELKIVNEKLNLEIFKSQMQAKLKYAILTADVEGNTLKCAHPNPFKSLTSNLACWVQTGNWMYFNLKEVFTVNFIRIRFYSQDHRVTTYNLGVSKDGQVWTSLAIEKVGGEIAEFKLPEPLQILYLRISGHNTKYRDVAISSLVLDWI